MHTTTLSPARTDLADAYVDLENIYGAPWHTLPSAQVRARTAALLHQLTGHRILVAGCAALLRHVVVELDAAGAAVRAVPPTPDAADQLLVGCLDQLPDRIRRVTVVSGDHVFADPVARLVAAGVHVTVVARRRSLAQSLDAAASETVTLQPPPPTAAPGISDLAALDAQFDDDDAPCHLVCPACAAEPLQALCGTEVDPANQIPPTEAIDACRPCIAAVAGHTAICASRR